MRHLFLAKHLLWLCGFSLAACNPCADEVVQEAMSPSGTVKAVFFVRNCGATADYASSVCIVSPDAKIPQDQGLVFSADSNHGAAPSKPEWRFAS